MPDRQLSLNIVRGTSPYGSAERIFNRLTFSISSAVNITDKVFVVDTVVSPGNEILMFPATPADLKSIPEDEPNADGYLRVSSFSVDFDNPRDSTEMIATIQARLKLLLDTLNALETTEEAITVIINND